MRQGNRDINDVVEEQINHYGQQAYRLGERAYNMTQKRKADGKKIFIATTKHMIGVTYRGLLGTKKTGKKTKRS